MAPPGNRALLRANPNWITNAINRTGYSNTHSGQIELERRFTKGVAFQWFYVFTSSLTTTDSGGFDAGNSTINSPGGGGQVPENIQLFGAPNLSYDERLRLVYFRSTTIPQHRIRYNAIVDLPFGRGTKIGDNVSGFVNQRDRRMAGGGHRRLEERQPVEHAPSINLAILRSTRISASR